MATGRREDMEGMAGICAIEAWGTGGILKDIVAGADGGGREALPLAGTNPGKGAEAAGRPAGGDDGLLRSNASDKEVDGSEGLEAGS